MMQLAPVVLLRSVRFEKVVAGRRDSSAPLA